tara:strand:+ start:338 stop:535 length:198 start_codon:yes stop_codon:yes gene_type:complete
MLDYLWIPVLIVSAVVVTIGAIITVTLVVIWIWNNRPFRIIRLSNDSINFIDDLQRDFYKGDLDE